MGLFTACVSTPAPAPYPYLPLAAEVALKRGLQAAQYHEWHLAIDYFKRAQAETPRDPRILYNLAVAYDHAGHDLMAGLWFRVYVATSPHAANADAVGNRITEIDLRVRNAARILLDEAQNQLANPAVRNFIPDDRGQPWLLGLRAALGDVEEARQTALTITPVALKNSAIKKIAEVQMAQGNIKGAQDTIQLIDDENLQQQTLSSIDVTSHSLKTFLPGASSLDPVELWLGLAERKSVSPLAVRTEDFVQFNLEQSQDPRNPDQGYRILANSAAEIAGILITIRRLENLIGNRQG